MAIRPFKGFLLALLAAIAMVIAGCGHSDEEMEGKQREIDKLNADLKAAKAEIASDQDKVNQAQADIDRMREELKQAGGDQARLQQALSEYKQRADQLAVIEQRFRDLKAKLDKLNQIGLKVVVRNNRMVIQLPGDILFDSGKDELKQGGKDVLGQVAAVIGGDKDLAVRNFQVAGHTDNAQYPAGGAFHDNWGLALSRARQVLVFLVTPNTAKPGAKSPNGGGLDPKHWAASGYGSTDPIAGTVDAQTKDEMQRNRRVELVVQPNVEEMLNLSAIK